MSEEIHSKETDLALSRICDKLSAEQRINITRTINNSDDALDLIVERIANPNKALVRGIIQLFCDEVVLEQFDEAFTKGSDEQNKKNDKFVRRAFALCDSMYPGYRRVHLPPRHWKSLEDFFYSYACVHIPCPALYIVIRCLILELVIKMMAEDYVRDYAYDLNVVDAETKTNKWSLIREDVEGDARETNLNIFFSKIGLRRFFFDCFEIAHIVPNEKFMANSFYECLLDMKK